MITLFYIYTKLYLWLMIQLSASSATFILTFGKGDDCLGFNICNIAEDNQRGKEENQARIFIHNRDGRVEFHFMKSSISDQSFLKYFSTGYFIVDADFTIPNHLVTNIGIKNNVIKAGKYKIAETSESYIVLF
jgi:hypothetical protein